MVVIIGVEQGDPKIGIGDEIMFETSGGLTEERITTLSGRLWLPGSGVGAPDPTRLFGYSALRAASSAR